MIKYTVSQDVAGAFRAQIDLGSESVFLKFKTRPSKADVEKAYDKYLDAAVEAADREIEKEALESSVTQYIENREALDEILNEYLADQAEIDEEAAEEIAEGRLLSGAAAQHRGTK